MNLNMLAKGGKEMGKSSLFKCRVVLIALGFVRLGNF